jgi:hypothetical protein
MKLLVMIILTACSSFAFATTYATKFYRCEAFNPVTGSAVIELAPDDLNAKLTISMSPFDLFTAPQQFELSGGPIIYDDAAYFPIPQASFVDQTTGIPFTMVFFPPAKRPGPEDRIRLYGVSFVPPNIAAFKPGFFHPFYSNPTQFSELVPATMGGKFTSFLTCVAVFEDMAINGRHVRADDCDIDLGSVE